MNLASRYGEKLILLGVLATANLWAQSKPPEVFIIDGSTLLAARDSYGKSAGEFKTAIDALLDDARKALKSEPTSVVQKTGVPPSGDKHDYMSLAPYWWPDSTKPGGVPYIRRDGERNPEYYSFGDHVALGKMTSNVHTLALAYFISRQGSFAEKAAGLLHVWFLDSATRMNPNLNFAQAIKGINNGRGIGIIETYQFRDLIDAMQLLKGSPHWTKTLDQGMKVWFSAYLKWLQESPNGKDESGEKNNHGSAYDIQVASIALYLGKKDVARDVLTNVPKKRMAVQIMADGSQPLELARTNSWGYSLMNTEALIHLALLGEHVGLDLWHQSDPDGRGIRHAIDFLLPYALGQKAWAWTQIVPMKREQMVPILRIAAVKYGDENYKKASEILTNADVMKSRENLVLPRSSTK
ncbi:MAG: alginate lyase family protein [Ignavibacteriales bacterium]|nr:alginate lyase family protein [Ignavibacteriales bacterium]